MAISFLRGSGRIIAQGNRAYKIWVGALLALIAIGLLSYSFQMRQGLIATNMRDQVSWAFYVGNFTFLVGIAAAAVMLVIPAYVYNWGPIKEVAILGELLAISAIIMCLLFVLVDMGRPDRFLHIVPFLGSPNFPISIMAWDALVLNIYLGVNLAVVIHILYKGFYGKDYNKKFVIPLVLFSIPMAVSIHTVTAFLYSGFAARPYWNTAILAPRFIVSAFCSGPAVLLVLFQVLRKRTGLPIKDEAIQKVAELMAYAMFLNLFLLGAEIFKEYYSHTEHLLYTQYFWSGLGPHTTLVKYAWGGLAASICAFFIFLVPRWRRNMILLNIGCALIYFSVYIEKGMGLVIPGMTPDTLGEIYEYKPTLVEWGVTAGIYGIGFLVFTVLVKLAVPIMEGHFHAVDIHPIKPEAGELEPAVKINS